MIKQIKQLYQDLPFEVKYIINLFGVLFSIYVTLEIVFAFAAVFSPYFGIGGATFVLLVAVGVAIYLRKR